MKSRQPDFDDDDLNFDNEEEDFRPPKSSYNRRKLEEYMDMKRLKEFLDDDYDYDYEDRI